VNVYIFDVVDEQGEIEVALMETTAPDATPVSMKRFHGTCVHNVFAEVASFVAAKRKERTACRGPTSTTVTLA
jgi:hypothetical protein